MVADVMWYILLVAITVCFLRIATLSFKQERAKIEAEWLRDETKHIKQLMEQQTEHFYRCLKLVIEDNQRKHAEANHE